MPRPYDQVVVFLNKNITCEGRYQIVYIFEFILLSHLCHGRLLNIPFYILRSLQIMAQYVKASRHPVSSLTNHGLIKLLVLRALAHQNLTWEQFFPRARVDREPVLEIEGIGEESDEPISSGSTGGRDGMSVDQLENVQEEGVREFVAVEAKTRAAIEAATVEVVTVEAAMEEEGHYTKAI